MPSDYVRCSVHGRLQTPPFLRPLEAGAGRVPPKRYYTIFTYFASIGVLDKDPAGNRGNRRPDTGLVGAARTNIPTARARDGLWFYNLIRPYMPFDTDKFISCNRCRVESRVTRTEPTEIPDEFRSGVPQFPILFIAYSAV